MRSSESWWPYVIAVVVYVAWVVAIGAMLLLVAHR
jgi:hypothetical protein